MNLYKDSMMAIYRIRMMNDKNGRPVPTARSLIARRKLAVEHKGGQRRKNESRLAIALKQGSGSSQRSRNVRRLALALV